MNSIIEIKERPIIRHHERLIMALDMPSIAEAQALVETLGDAVTFYKAGMELFMCDGYFDFISWLQARQKKFLWI